MPNDTTIDLALTILDPDLCAELSKRLEGEQRNEFAIALMKIGSLALREAQGRNDADRVRAERERLIEDMIKALEMNQLTSETPRAIAVDWSGAQEPKGKIWAAVAVGPRLEVLQMKHSREDAVDWLIEQLKQQPNTIAGLDFAFSMPAWFVRKHGCDTAIDFWTVVEREGEKWLECCRNPFWGKEGTKMPRDCELFRETERAVRKANPKSTFLAPIPVCAASTRRWPVQVDATAAVNEHLAAAQTGGRGGLGQLSLLATYDGEGLWNYSADLSTSRGQGPLICTCFLSAASTRTFLLSGDTGVTI